MPKEISLGLKICDNVTKYSIYALVFLLPLFFLPWTVDVLDFNKQAMLLVLTLVALLAWVIKTLITGSISVNNHRINIAVGALFLVYLLSFVFSVSRFGSFWGWPQPAYESLLSIICFCVAYFLISTQFSEKEVSQSYTWLCISFLIVGFYGALQLLGVHILGFAFAKNIYFNTIGSVGGLGLYAVMILPLAIMRLITAQRWWRVLYGAAVFLVFVLLLLINYTYLWWLVLAVAGLLVVFWVLKRDLFSGTWMFLPTFFLLVSLFFIILHPELGFLAKKPLEVTLSAGANTAIDIKTLKHDPLFGSGPGTFMYDFLKYKNQDLNSTSFWNVQFDFGFSKLLTNLSTTGILGILAWLALVSSALFCAVKKFWLEKSGKTTVNFHLLLAITMALFTQTLGSVFFNTGLALEFTQFLFIGSLVALMPGNRATYVLKPSSIMTMVITFAFTAAAVFGLGFLMVGGKRYVAQLHYVSALQFAAKGNIDASVAKLQKAAGMDNFDLYFRQLSQVYLLKIQTIAKNNPNPSEKQQEELKILVANAINSAKTATDLNEKNVNNWLFRASVYQNLIGLVTDANSWAIKSYDAAIALSPQNPYILLQKGLVYYQQKDYKNAREVFEKALALKPDYADLLYYAGLTYDNLGQKDKAISSFSKIISMDPQNVTVQAILQNLKSGKPALDGMITPSPAPAPITPSAPLPSDSKK